MDLEFANQVELYQRLKPALFAKKRQMIREGYSYIDEEDIWSYLKEKVWPKAKSLLLHEMVSDIINVDNYYVDEFFKEKLKREKRSQN